MPATSEHAEEYWTERCTSKRTRTGLRTLQRWRSEGRGPPYVRFGPRKILYRRSAVEAWIREREFKHRADELSRGPHTAGGITIGFDHGHPPELEPITKTSQRCADVKCSGA